MSSRLPASPITAPVPAERGPDGTPLRAEERSSGPRPQLVQEEAISDRSQRRQNQRTSVLSPSLPPRGLSRVEAAAYIGVSATTFDHMVQRREMPRPKRIGSRVVWDRIKLDFAFAALPGNDNDDANPFD
jgi:predicted DNA-binding transcriptional regulator AlpA